MATFFENATVQPTSMPTFHRPEVAQMLVALRLGPLAAGEVRCQALTGVALFFA